MGSPNEHEDIIEIISRGAVEIINKEELDNSIKNSFKNKKPLKIKAGFDPTAPDLHLGHTVLLQKMKHFQDMGHEIIFLIGDFTGMIGDPTGKSQTRIPLTREEIDKNSETYKEQVFKILDPDLTKVVFNSKWLNKLSSADMVKLSSHYTVARILERDDFHKRFISQQPVSIHEFLYPLLQAYDSVVLESDIELGGTDQKFNLLLGRDIQRAYDKKPQVVITMPILEGLDGVQKMSKSLGNYIGINEPPDKMFGKIMSISDDLMFRYYELLSDKTLSEISGLRSGIKDERIHPKKVKQDIACEIVSRFHSSQAARNAMEEFEKIFARKGIPDNILCKEIKATEESVLVIKVMAHLGMAKGTSDARRLLAQGAVSIDSKKVVSHTHELFPGNTYLLKVGKKKFLNVSVKK